MDDEKHAHWDGVYTAKGEGGLSWFEQEPTVSFELIKQCGISSTTSLIDIGGGASRLVDRLIADYGLKAVAVLDLSAAVLSLARERLGAAAADVDWILADVRHWTPVRQYDIWHDRGTFHFMTSQTDRAAYLERLQAAVKPDGRAIIGTFAVDGPERCSGLPVARYDANALAGVVGPPFRLVDCQHHIHTTPWGAR